MGGVGVGVEVGLGVGGKVGVVAVVEEEKEEGVAGLVALPGGDLEQAGEVEGLGLHSPELLLGGDAGGLQLQGRPEERLLQLVCGRGSARFLRCILTHQVFERWEEKRGGGRRRYLRLLPKKRSAAGDKCRREAMELVHDNGYNLLAVEGVAWRVLASPPGAI